MKRLTFVLAFMLCCMAGSAQVVQFGYLSYERVLEEMPDYAQAKQELAILKSKYEAEAQKGEEEFQRRFVDFLQGQKDFPLAIMQKRQAELQTMMDNGVAFRLKSQELIAQAEKELFQGVRTRLHNAVLVVGAEFGYGYILNTDAGSCPYINPAIGVDVTDLVRQKLGLIPVTETPPAAIE